MKFKDIFNGIANIFKSKNEDNKINNDKYKTNEIHKENINEKEINFEKLKKIKEHEETYNYQNNNLNNNQVEYTINTDIQSRQIQNKTITNTLESKTEDTIKTITIEELKNDINTIWDIIKIKENTQAEHIIKCTPTNKWITMDELRQNIKLEFNVEYTNEKSLYPYLKTLVDVNLIKMNNIGKKRTWKKNIIIIENNNRKL